MNAISIRSYVFLLGLLLAAFLARMLIQLMQAWRPFPWLPRFASWHSAALPYPVLVTAQVVIAGLCAWTIWGIATGEVKPDPTAGRILLALGLIYFCGMIARLLLGLTVLRQVGWFNAPLPSIFHIVLASFVLTTAHYNLYFAGR